MAATVISRLPDRYAEMPTGWNPVDHTVELPITSIDEAGDDTLCFLFPSEAYLDVQSLHIDCDDLDSHATPTIVFDVGIGDSDGVIDTVLINDSAAGQTGAFDDADSAPGGTLAAKYLDVSNKYLILTIVTAAATDAAGGVKFNFQWSKNLVPTSTSS